MEFWVFEATTRLEGKWLFSLLMGLLLFPDFLSYITFLTLSTLPESRTSVSCLYMGSEFSSSWENIQSWFAGGDSFTDPVWVTAH